MTQVTAASIIGTPFGLVWCSRSFVLLRRSDVYNFESPVRQWRWEEVAGPGAIRFSLFGYQAARVCAWRASRLIVLGHAGRFDLGSMEDDPTVGGQVGPDDDDETPTAKRGDDEPEARARGRPAPGRRARGQPWRPEVARGGRDRRRHVARSGSRGGRAGDHGRRGRRLARADVRGRRRLVDRDARRPLSSPIPSRRPTWARSPRRRTSRNTRRR